ncbi:hypothetical protein [Spirosoma telluris]|uniref:hypothetical protein n=1 Tax=Spirosoma telluris TaxID=2183553 RepID=UPI0018DCA6B6
MLLIEKRLALLYSNRHELNTIADNQSYQVNSAMKISYNIVEDEPLAQELRIESAHIKFSGCFPERRYGFCFFTDPVRRADLSGY